MGVPYQLVSACRVSSRFVLLRPGKPALIPPPGLDICLPWESSVSLGSVTDDSSPLLSSCWPGATPPSYLRWKFKVVFRVSCMTVLCLPPLPELTSLASKSARAFFSLGTCTSSNIANDPFRTWTYTKYAAIRGSLAWYSPFTWPVTSRESLFANKLCAPISLANSMPTMRASYSDWLLLALKANCRACSINSPFGPSNMTPTLLPCWLEDLSTESTH